MGCCGEAYNWSTADNTRFYKTKNVSGTISLDNLVSVYEDGWITQDGAPVSTLHPFKEQLTLKLRRQGWKHKIVDPTGLFLGILPWWDLSVLTWDSRRCGWFGSVSHPGGINQPEMFVSLYAARRQSGFLVNYLYGKMWGASWSEQQWLRISAGDQGGGNILWQTQPRGAELGPDAASVMHCEGWWDDVADFPSWMRGGIPESYTVSFNVPSGCQATCDGFTFVDFDLRGDRQFTAPIQTWKFCRDSGFTVSRDYKDESLHPFTGTDCTWLSPNKGVVDLQLSQSIGRVTAYTGIVMNGQITWVREESRSTWNPWGASTLYAQGSTLYPSACLGPAVDLPPVTITGVDYGSGGNYNAGGW